MKTISEFMWFYDLLKIARNECNRKNIFNSYLSNTRVRIGYWTIVER